MGDWALGSGFRSETLGATSGTTTRGGTAVTGSATADTKGSWSQIAASTGFSASAILLSANAQFLDTNYLLDIGIGGSGSEQVLIPDLMIAVPNGVTFNVMIPVAIPAGSRLAARCADSFGSSALYVSAVLFSDSFLNYPPVQTITAYGVDAANSAGTVVNAGASANTKGSWTQIAASTSRTCSGLMIAAVRPSQNVVAQTSPVYHLADIAVGASGSEQILVSDLRFESNVGTGGLVSGSPTNKGALQPGSLVLPPCDIPQGSRLAMRLQSTSTDAEDRTIAFVLYGLE